MTALIGAIAELHRKMLLRRFEKNQARAEARGNQAWLAHQRGALVNQRGALR